MNNFHDVGRFHERFELDNVTYHAEGPRQVPSELIDFRLKFIFEELMELAQALDAKDTVKVADSLIDLVYVTMGFAHLLGLPWQELWDEVQAANMKKVRALKAEDSTRASTYDVVKPPGWQPPDIEGVLRSSGWQL